MVYVCIVLIVDNYLYYISNGSFDVDVDEFVLLGGQGKGFVLFDLYLVLLVVCIVIILCMYVQCKGWELGEFYVELCLECDEDGCFYVYCVLYVSVELSDVQWQWLLEVVEKILVILVMCEGVCIISECGVVV